MRRPVSSSMNPVEITSYDDYLIQGRSPYTQRRFPMKTFIVGAALLIGGIIFLSLGLSIVFSSTLSHGKDRGLLFLILGGISKQATSLLLQLQSLLCHIVLLFLHLSSNSALFQISIHPSVTAAQRAGIQCGQLSLHIAFPNQSLVFSLTLTFH